MRDRQLRGALLLLIGLIPPLIVVASEGLTARPASWGGVFGTELVLATGLVLAERARRRLGATPGKPQRGPRPQPQHRPAAVMPTHVAAIS